MLKKLLLLLFLSVMGVALHSYFTGECSDERTTVSLQLADDEQSVPQDQFVLSLPVGDLLYSGSETHTQISNIYLRTLQQLFLQWNRMVVKDHSRYLQRAQSVSPFTSYVAYYIGCEVDASLYIYRIRHIII